MVRKGQLKMYFYSHKIVVCCIDMLNQWSFSLFSFSLHPSLPLIATASGRRHFPDIYDSDDSDIETNDNDNVIENSLKLWWL